MSRVWRGMRGNIREKVKGQRYELRVSLGKDPITGKYRQKSLSVRGTKAAAECGVVLAADAFVFSRRPGGTHPLRPDNCTTTFERLRKRAGLSGFSFKDATRHLAATRLIGAGVDVRTVAGRLGHARASTTLDIYSHFLPERDREAAEILGALLDSPIS